MKNLFNDCGENMDSVPTFWTKEFAKGGGNFNVVACSLEIFDEETRPKAISDTNIQFERIKKNVTDLGEAVTVNEDYFGKQRELKISIECQQIEVEKRIDILSIFKFPNYEVKYKIINFSIRYQRNWIYSSFVHS